MNEEERAKARERQRKYRADPEHREERRARANERRRQRMEDPAYRAAHNSGRKEYRREWARDRRADPARREAECEYKNEWRRQRFETDAEYRARTKARNVRRRRLVQGADAEVFDYQEIFERDGWVCQLCFEPVDPELKAPQRMSATLDHIVPLSKGGPHTRDNAQLAHLSCNSAKQDR